MVADKPRAVTTLVDVDKTGAFVRKDSEHRQWIKAGSAEFPPAANRYHLYICWACPWASRCAAVLYLKGLQDVIGLSATHPTWQKTSDDESDTHWGWTFATYDDPPFSNAAGHGKIKPKAGLLPDTINHTRNIRELYTKAGSKAEKFTVPVLWDKETGSIINNESSEIMRMLNSEFNEFATKNKELDLYPKHLRKAIDEVNAWVYPSINNGVYRTGFAQTQEAYEGAFKDVFEGLDRAEGVLAKQRWIAGDQFTEADIRLFVTLIRFDHAYVAFFKCNKRFIHQYPNLKAYTSEIYQMEGVTQSVNLEHIKLAYHTVDPKLNYYAIVPVGPPEWFKEPHNRGQ